jgi:hypothetical protein
MATTFPGRSLDANAIVYEYGFGYRCALLMKFSMYKLAYLTPVDSLFPEE